MKRVDGHLYETVATWHPVIIRQKGDWFNDVVHRPTWLNKHCPDGHMDYDAYVYHDDTLMDPDHRTIYFFRDEHVAVLFALRWA